MKLADAGVALADQRRLATQMAVLAQVHLARQQYANMLRQYQRADAIWNTDARIAEHLKNREAAQAQSKLDVVASQTATILSLLRRYQAMAQLQTADARLQATLGIEPVVASVDDTALGDLALDLGRARQAWSHFPASAPAAAKAPQ